MTPYSKYQVERAKNGKGLVHIRCCYSNKYCVMWSKNHWWIVVMVMYLVRACARRWRCSNTPISSRPARDYACLWRLPEPGRSRDTHIWSLHQVTLETRLWERGLQHSRWKRPHKVRLLRQILEAQPKLDMG